MIDATPSVNVDVRSASLVLGGAGQKSQTEGGEALAQDLGRANNEVGESLVDSENTVVESQSELNPVLALPAVDSLARLHEKIKSFEPDPMYREPQRLLPSEEQGLSYADRIAQRRKQIREQFADLCAHCHHFDDRTVAANTFSLSLQSKDCRSIDCADMNQLALYIDRYMPYGKSNYCRERCAGDLALYVYYQGNDLLAALHQVMSRVFVDADIVIRDEMRAGVLYQR
ncbi:MAG: hypothetical protein P8176_10410 [Gammaproteobacteria bacterium]